ncbi:MAG TPA: hypothetical protein VKT78_12085 [Fimbriimonadaceae bacterium]|nr:hypothetical protein [Fimbriimonadaceae bacterium]
MTVLEIAADVAGRLDALGIPYAIGGSVASSTWGQMRQTNDIDIAILLSPPRSSELLSAFDAPYHLGSEELVEALASEAEFRSVQVIQMEEAFKIDLFLLQPGEYTDALLGRARTMEVLPGERLRFYAAEDIVLAKLRWFRLGNEVSDRQWNDIVNVVEVQSGQLDGTYLARWARHFGVEANLNRALDQAAR